MGSRITMPSATGFLVRNEVSFSYLVSFPKAALPFQKHLQSAPSTPASPHNLMTHGSVAGPSRAGSTYHFEPQEAAHLERGGSSDDDNLAKVGKGWLGEIDGLVLLFITPHSSLIIYAVASLKTYAVLHGKWRTGTNVLQMELNEKVKMKLDIHGTPAENLQRLITDCGVSPHKIAELVQELPPKPFADRIIDWFFAKLNFIRYPIDERLFRASYEDLYNKSTALDPSNVRALPLVFIVLALAVRQAPEKWAGNEQTRRLSSLRMYWSCEFSSFL